MRAGKNVLVLMMRVNESVREEEMDGWAERCIEDLRRRLMDLGRRGKTMGRRTSDYGPQRPDSG